MKPFLTIQELTENPNFSINVVINEAIAKATTALFTDYSLDSQKATIHLTREHPNQSETEVHQHIFFRRTNTAENKAFFQQLENYAFHQQGELDSDDFKEAFLPIYTKQLKDKLGYGENAQLTKIVATGGHAAMVYFTTDKTVEFVDDEGVTKSETSTRKHQAFWKLLNPKEDLNATIVFPRALFNTPAKFLNQLAAALDVDINRIYLKDDPTDRYRETIEVYFNATDLVYAGSLTVALSPVGEEIKIYSNTTGEELPVGGAPTPSTGVTVQAKMTFKEAFNTPTNYLAQFAAVGDIVNLVIRPTGLTAPLAVKLVPKVTGVTLSLDNEQVTLTPGQDLVVPVMIEAVTGDVNNISRIEVLSLDGKTIYGQSGAVKVTATTTIPSTIHNAPPLEVKVNDKFKAEVIVQGEPIYTFRNVTWSVVPAGAATIVPNANNYDLDAEITVSGSLAVGDKFTIKVNLGGGGLVTFDEQTVVE